MASAVAARREFYEVAEAVTHYARHLGALAADAAGELDVLGHDGDALGVDGAEVGVLEKADQVRLGCLLQGQDGRGLEAEVRLAGTRVVQILLTTSYIRGAEGRAGTSNTGSRGGVRGRWRRWDISQLTQRKLVADGAGGRSAN